MIFSEALFHDLVAGQIRGSFGAFAAKSAAQVDAYIAKLVVRLRENPVLMVTTEPESYGSGYASYVSISISKADRSDTVTYATTQRVVYDTRGILLYISRLAPYWYYGAGNWTKNSEYGSYTGGSSTFLEPINMAQLDHTEWADIEH